MIKSNSLKNITIAIDVMGGDHGLQAVLPACIDLIKKKSNLKLLLVGDKDQIVDYLDKYHPIKSDQIVVIHASEVVSMDDLPSFALRNKRNSSMRIAINLVKDGMAQACVSSGNTGALMATAKYVLKTLPGIDRPAIIAALPTLTGKTRVVDLGANVDSCAEHLFQFAIMGVSLIQAVDKNPQPRVGLLNIGVEEIKGNDQVKRTAHMLNECGLINYVGYVEGNQLFTGDVDLVVCDGFVGNAALKASEGLAKLMLTFLRQLLGKGILNKLAAIIARPALRSLKMKLDPARYNGASLLGLNGIVVKSHGGADAIAFQNAIEEAIVEVQNNLIGLVRSQITEFINQGLLL